MEPLISVIVPVYKVEQYLHQCVDSILAQTYKNLEIILVDDGSPDNCGAICDEYACIDSRVHVIHKKNGGQSSARNAGLDVCHGEYISFVDSDDLLELSLYAKLMVQAPFKLLLFGCTMVDNRGSVQEIRSPCRLKTEKCCFQNDAEKVEHLVRSSLYGYVCNKIYHISVLQNLRFYEVPFREDLLFNIEVMRLLTEICMSNVCGYSYYQHVTSTLHSGYSGIVPDIAPVFRGMTTLHPNLPKHINQKLSNYIIKTALLDFSQKYIFRNQSLCAEEEKEWIKELFSYASIRKILRPYRNENKAEQFLTLCYKLRIPMAYYRIMRRVWNNDEERVNQCNCSCL